MRQTNIPYTGRLTVDQQGELIELLWDSLRRVPGVDQVQTGWGTKTQTGLLACIERIMTPVNHWTADLTTEEIFERR